MYLFFDSSVSLSDVFFLLFLQNAFRDYARGTEAALVFGVEVTHLPFFGVLYRYHVFEYLLFACFLLTVTDCVVRCCCCSNKQQQRQQLAFTPIPRPLLQLVERADADPAAAAAQAAAAAAAAAQEAATGAATAAAAGSVSTVRQTKGLGRFFKGSSETQQPQQQQQQREFCESPFSKHHIQFAQGPGALQGHRGETPEAEGGHPAALKKKKWGKAAAA
ncbi:hypothetical protein Efla_005461 [Eimeria flavescens]